MKHNLSFPPTTMVLLVCLFGSFIVYGGDNDFSKKSRAYPQFADHSRSLEIEKNPALYSKDGERKLQPEPGQNGMHIRKNGLTVPQVISIEPTLLTGTADPFMGVYIYAYSGGQRLCIGQSRADKTGYFEWFGSIPGEPISLQAVDAFGYKSPFSEPAAIEFELVYFSVSPKSDHSSLISWQANNEYQTCGYWLQRRTPFSSYENIRFTKCAQNEDSVYEIEDAITAAGIYFYRLIREENSGTQHVLKEDMVEFEDAGERELFVVEHNPFSTSADIRLNFAQVRPVELNIYNQNGQKVKTLIHGRLKPGLHNILWDGRDTLNREVSTGEYFFVLEDGGKYYVQRTMVVR
jgi:hypothetical protein